MEKADPTKAPELLWRRLLEPMADWVVFVPLIFALLVVALLFLYRRENRGVFLIWSGALLGVFAAVYLPLAFLLKGAFSWLVVVVPILAVALVYVALMYVKDSRSINPFWAAFLGLCRCTVYAILTVVFLLPGCQSYETVQTQSKIVLLIDVSKSMDSQDREPSAGMKPGDVPTRKQEVLRMLKKPLNIKDRPEANILQLVMEKTPVTLYRFGGRLDERDVVHFTKYEDLAGFDWDAFLSPDPLKVAEVKPDIKPGMPPEQVERLTKKAQEDTSARRNEIENILGGTNLYGALDKVSKLESSNYVQAIVVISDGHSNSGSEDALREFFARVEKPNPPIHVLAIGVGEDRVKVKVDIADLLAPMEIRPDDKFPIRVVVTGENLRDEPTDVRLELKRIKNKDGQVVTEAPFDLGLKTGKFKGGGDFPKEEYGYDVDLKELAKIKSSDEKDLEPLEGVWVITAKVKRHPRENFKEEYHTATSELHVQGKKLRVLLFSGGPMRDYQFVRTLFYRESVEKRLEFCVYLQTAGAEHVDQDVEPERLLSKFPDRLGAPTKDDPFGTLSAFDVIIAFDPDWTALTASQLKLLKKWVGSESGSIVFAAGPINTYQLARKPPDDEKGLQSLRTLVPVFLKDSRLHAIAAAGGHDASRPYALRFEQATRDTKDFDFLRLEDSKDWDPVAGWDKFFWGVDVKGDLKEVPKRGFHWYYPVDGIKPGSTVLATLVGHPPDMKIKINEKDSDQPFMVTMKYGNGKCVYIGSAETWRLRAAKELFHDRFWIKLARFASSGVTQQKKFGQILMSSKAVAGKVAVEVQIKGDDLLPVAKTTRAVVEAKKLDKFGDTRAVKYDLKPKALPGEWAGWFEGSVELRDEGEYQIRVPIPGTGEALTHTIRVTKPDVETDNVRTNFPALYGVATEAGPLLNKLEGDTIKEVKARIQIPAGATSKGATAPTTDRLYLPLSQADILPECLRKVPPRESTVKGSLDDLWDEGAESGWKVNSALLATLIPIGVGVLGFAILMFIGQILGAVMFLGGFALLSLLALGFYLVSSFTWPDLDVNFSFVLIGCVGLLGIEWLTRKLLKLA